METIALAVSALFPVLIFVSIAFGRDLMDMAHRRQIARLAPDAGRMDRLRALEFVAAHPDLKRLDDADALTVATVLQTVLDRKERESRRFQLVVAAMSLLAGVALTRLVG